ncbi:MAG: allantoinase, partial [Gaiellales bacterium]|nr:allantoinase [Gaiellales bacterium]
MSGRRTLIAGGTLATDRAVFPADILIEDGRVAAIGRRLSTDGVDDLIDAAGLVVMPGAIDMHAHFEDPGHTEREDFTTGTMSAAAGGITTVMEHPL